MVTTSRWRGHLRSRRGKPELHCRARFKDPSLVSDRESRFARPLAPGAHIDKLALSNDARGVRFTERGLVHLTGRVYGCAYASGKARSDCSRLFDQHLLRRTEMIRFENTLSLEARSSGFDSVHRDDDAFHLRSASSSASAVRKKYRELIKLPQSSPKGMQVPLLATRMRGPPCRKSSMRRRH